jgi:dienelactone hydrolase
MAGQGGRRWRRWLVGILVALVALGGAAYLGVGYMIYDGLGTAPKACWPEYQANTPQAYTLPKQYDQTLATKYAMPVPQDVAFHSRDPQMPNANLAAWWIPASANAASAPAVVLVHGVKSCRRESSVLLAAGMLHQAGYSVFLMDLRDHGDSQGDDGKFSGGTDEYLDVLGGWDWVRAQGVPTAKIGLLGFSFGSGTVMVAAGHEPLVAAAWVDSGYTITRTAIGLFLKDQTGLPDFLVPGALLWANVIAHDNLVAFDPITEVAKLGGRSIAFVHGQKDQVLPYTMAQELRTAAVAAGATSPEAWIVPGAKHTESIYIDPAGYAQHLTAFFGAAIGTSG